MSLDDELVGLICRSYQHSYLIAAQVHKTALVVRFPLLDNGVSFGHILWWQDIRVGVFSVLGFKQWLELNLVAQLILAAYAIDFALNIGKFVGKLHMMKHFLSFFSEIFREGDLHILW